MEDSYVIKPVSFKANTIIFKEGDQCDAAYLITKGLVEVRIGCYGGRPMILASLGEHDVVGEMAVFDDQPRMATAVAVRDTEALMMSRDELNRRFNEIDPVLKGIVLLMVKRLRLMANELKNQTGGVIVSDRRT